MHNDLEHPLIVEKTKSGGYVGREDTSRRYVKKICSHCGSEYVVIVDSKTGKVLKNVTRDEMMKKIEENSILHPME